MKKLAGFTLLEILVTTAIIGTLAAILLPNLNAARERSRDAVRKGDLSAIQKALELYKQDRTPPSYIPAGGGSTFPNGGNCWYSTGAAASCPANANVYLKKVPVDPKTSPGTAYYYAVAGLTYTLGACLENPADAAAVACPGGFACTSGKCYIVTEQ
jgi:general secretion pathway protein G